MSFSPPAKVRGVGRRRRRRRAHSVPGNGIRYFPHTGYLGLTPVKVEGGLYPPRRAEPDADPLLKSSSPGSTRTSSRCQPDPSPLLCAATSCYSAAQASCSPTCSPSTPRLSGSVPRTRNTRMSGIWNSPSGCPYPPGSADTVPRLSWSTDAYGVSKQVSPCASARACALTARFPVLNHSYISGVGTRIIKVSDLPLIRYDVPSPPLNIPRPLPSNGLPRLEHQIYTKSRAARIRYSILTPSTPIGPMDLVSISMHLLSDPSVVVRSASAIVERRIHTKDTSGSSPSQSQFSAETASPPHATSPYHHNSLTSSSSSSSSLLSSNPTITQDNFAASTSTVVTEQRPLLSVNFNLPQSRPSTSTSSMEIGGSRSSIHPIVGTESSGSFSRDQNGIFSKTLTVPWPVPKSNSRWAIGESIQTEFISVKFFVRVKVILRTA